MVSIEKTSDTNLEKLITFRLEANVNTYAAYMNEMESTRPDSHGYTYSKGAYTLSPYTYISFPCYIISSTLFPFCQKL